MRLSHASIGRLPALASRVRRRVTRSKEVGGTDDGLYAPERPTALYLVTHTGEGEGDALDPCIDGRFSRGYEPKVCRLTAGGGSLVRTRL